MDTEKAIYEVLRDKIGGDQHDLMMLASDVMRAVWENLPGAVEYELDIFVDIDGEPKGYGLCELERYPANYDIQNFLEFVDEMEVNKGKEVVLAGYQIDKVNTIYGIMEHELF